ncbi:hypothetical protein Acr_21g0011520 [Actinidia rufa]|uniref:Uncharacterized protein n=1 Tax=Actinidia rufa TaxID=165716 RepID=A0A7J0GIB3_9ERIC|nr:hypothetical protein Acr_21g0011520 [Actinidia rufa]
MDTSIRYGADSTALRIHAKEKFPIDSNTHLQLSASLGVGLQYNRHEKARYSVRGKTAFPVTTNGLLQFNIKGRCDVDKEFRERKLKGAAEFTWGILDFQKDQDMRLKVGYEVFDKVPYLQIRENNWTLNVDINGRWNVRYDLWKGESLI